MFESLKLRLVIWKRILWRPISAVWGGFFLLAEIFNFVREELPPEMREKWRIVNVIPWPWWIWIIIGLIGFILISLEGAYRLISQKEDELDILRKELNKNDDFIPLKKAIQQLYNECTKRPLCNMFIEEHIKGENSHPSDVWTSLAELFFQCTVIPIYGKDIYSNELTEIDKSCIGNMYFDDEVSSLQILIGKKQRYTEPSIRKNEVERAISEIIVAMEKPN